MRKYPVGIKGDRQQKRWKPKSKYKWVIYRAVFLKENGLLLTQWW